MLIRDRAGCVWVLATMFLGGGLTVLALPLVPSAPRGVPASDRSRAPARPGRLPAARELLQSDAGPVSRSPPEGTRPERALRSSPPPSRATLRREQLDRRSFPHSEVSLPSQVMAGEQAGNRGLVRCPRW